MNKVAKVCHSIERMTITVVITGQNVFPATEVIENDIPLLLGKVTMKKGNTYTNFAYDKIIILNKEIPVKFTTSSHYCISKEKVDDNQY